MPSHAQFFLDEKSNAFNALARGRAYTARAKQGADAAFYAAPLAGEALCAGAWQRVQGDAHAAGTTNRRTGGRTVFAGEGVFYLAIGLRDASVLMACPRDRVLNRNVRGALVGLSTTGVPTHYFGRDFLSVQMRPAVYAAWTRDAEGFVMLEMFVGVSRAFTPTIDDASLGKPPITLQEAYGRVPSAEEIAERIIVRGYADKFALSLTESALRQDESNATALASRIITDEAMHWSARAEVPIGFIEAGLSVRDNGLIASAQIAGDFFQDETAPALLQSALVGRAPSPELFVSAINQAYGPSGAVMEGLKSLQPILQAFTSLI